MTHAELVKRAVSWLRGTRNCRVVLSEVQSAAGEVADAIGWATVCRSILVECKTSRGDFNADRHKPWRRVPDLGLGHERFYLTRSGLIRPEELPAGWGLLEVSNGRMRVVVKSERHPARREGELTLLVSELARYQAQGIRYLKISELGGATALQKVEFARQRRADIEEAQAIMGGLGIPADVRDRQPELT